ncbi:MAG: adenylate/guanylate cyclase domain-containing protein [bacterium]
MLDERNLSINKKKGPILDERHLSKGKDEKPADPLTARLHAALEAGRRSDQVYREKFVKKWAVVFVDVSETSKELWGQDNTDAVVILREYQAKVRPILKRHEATYVSETPDSPQVVACFEKPEQAAEATVEVQHILMTWTPTQENAKHLIPSIGMHIGDVVYDRGDLQQSNACNLAKRVQTESKPGQIFLSKPMHKALEQNTRYTMKFVRTARVKNIPLPQDIYQLNWADIDVETEEEEATAGSVEGYCQRHAIFYIDVCESSKKFWNLGDRMGNELIKDYQNIVEPVLKKHGCSYQESSEGDQVMGCFPGKQPHRAVDAAIEIQGLLFRRNTVMNEKKQVRAAIGLHIGDIVRQRKEIVQTVDLQIGKGVQGEAGADEIFISKTLYELFEEENRYEMKYVGTSKLKGVEDPQDIYQIIWHRSDGRQMRANADRRKIEQGLMRLQKMKQP